MKQHCANWVSRPSKAVLVVELLYIFVVLPLLAFRFSANVPGLLVLFAIAAPCLFYLLKSGRLLPVLILRSTREHWRRLGLFLCLATVLAGTVLALWQPEFLLSFPRDQTSAWLWFLALYPLLSVLPQELVFRAFFFDRYRRLFPGRGVMILVNSLLFSLAHIVYNNFWAVALTFLGGLLFASTYQRTRSLPLVIFEHSAYGCMIFTMGYARYLGA
jgi:membrane protease YdiL (CAAX protease family)